MIGGIANRLAVLVPARTCSGVIPLHVGGIAVMLDVVVVAA